MHMSSKIMFSIAVMFLSALTVLASPTPSTPQQRAKVWTDWMQTELKLSPAQLAPVQEINLRYAQKIEALKNKDESKMEKFDELKAYDKLKDADLKLVLTKNQYEVYLKKKKDKQKEMLKSYRDKN